MTYLDEERILNTIDLTSIIDAEETVTVIGVATNDNGTAGDTTDDFQELTYMDEDRVVTGIDLSAIIDAQETLTVIGVTPPTTTARQVTPPTIFRN